jgi:RNA polymerase sigma-70 factor (ECF subfamily)
VLDPDATAISDGGGRVRALRRPLRGADRIVRAYLGFRTRGFALLERSVNGRPGLVARQDGVTVTVWAFDIAGDRITRIWAVRNPEKLRVWQRVT